MLWEMLFYNPATGKHMANVNLKRKQFSRYNSLETFKTLLNVK
jgi:hypothetical protein